LTIRSENLIKFTTCGQKRQRYSRLTLLPVGE